MESFSNIKSVDEEEAEFEYDLRLARRWKRRRIAYENLRKSCGNKRLKKIIYQKNKNHGALATVDLDSETFFNDREMFVGVNSGSRSVDCADGNDGDDKVSDVFDPQYMMFLSNLKEDRKSYVLELALGNDGSIVVKYEKEDGSNTGLDVENSETSKCCRNEKKARTENILRNCADRENIEKPRSLTSDLGRDKSEHLIMVSGSNLGRKKGESLGRFPRTSIGSEKSKNQRRVLRNKSWRQKRVTFSSNSGTEKTESPRKPLRSISNRKNNERPSIMHGAVKIEKTESQKPLLSNSRRESNERPGVIGYEVKSKKTDSQRTWRSNSRRENNESPSIMDAAVKIERTESQKTSRSNSRRENNIGPRIMNDAVKREKTESRRTLQSNSRRENMHGVVKREKNESRRTSRGNLRRENNLSPNIMHDVVKREKTESQSTLRSKSRKENNGSLSIMHAAVKREKAGTARTLRHVLRRESMGTLKKIREPMLEKNVGMEAEHHVISAENGCLNKRHIPKVTTNSAKYKCNQGGKSHLRHENYLHFMKFAKAGKQLVYEPEGGKAVLCEESDSDSEVVVLDNDPFSGGNYTPFLDTDGECCVSILTGSKESHFREELMKFLQKPYDRMEYKKLSLEASRPRPSEDDGYFPGDLRRKRRLCGLDFNGKSYLDEYSDLASLIAQAQHDRRRILNLLRGFFYWLQNLVHEDEGAFKPWLDSSCLSILPPLTWDLSSDGDCYISGSQSTM